MSVHENYQDQSMSAYLYEKIAGRLAFMSVGDVRTGTDAEQALENSDLVALGRVLLSDPNRVSKVIAGKEQFIRYDIAKEDMDLLGLTSGVWGIMRNSMADHLK